MGRTRQLRGNRTHGRGKKAGRGKGKRGGRGQAGLLKHKFKWMVKHDPEHFGPRGFTVKSPRSRPTTLNVGALEAALPELEAAGFVRRDEGSATVDLTEAGVGKLLGGGRLFTPLKVLVPVATTRAVEKVEATGGEVVQAASEG